MGLWGKKQPSPDVLHAQGVAAFENGDGESALKIFANLCDIEPTSERLYYLGVLLDLIGDPDGATRALRQSVEMDPNNTQALYSLSIVCLQLTDFDTSFDAVKRAYAVDPNDFRIVNHYAMMLCQSPNEAHRDPPKALELAQRACELTDWEDEICLKTYEAAKEEMAIPGAAEEVEREAARNAPGDLTFEIIAHFEERFSRKANALSLQNIVAAAEVPIAVQTIESDSASKPSVIFTTGVSTKRMHRTDGEALEFAELFMFIPGDWRIGEEIDERIWPWGRLQQLAYLPQLGEEGFSRKPQVIALPDAPTKLGEGADFAAFLLLPNVKGYIDKYVTENDRSVKFILAMPIYEEEYQLGLQDGGAEALLDLIRQSKTKPYLTPARPNLAKQS